MRMHRGKNLFWVGDQEQQLLAKYTLVICIFSLAIYMFYVWYGFKMEMYDISIVCSLYMTGSLIALALNIRGNYSMAKVLVILTAAFSVSFTYHTFTIGPSVLTIFFPVILANFYLFAFEKERGWMMSSGVLTILLLICTLICPRFEFLMVELPKNIVDQINHIHEGVAILITGFLLVISVHIKSRVNKELVEKKDALEQALMELTETRDQLIQAEKMASLGLLTAGINHEINNPLNFLVGGIENMKRIKTHGGTQEDMELFFNIVEEGVDRISKIVKSLNHFNDHPGGYYADCDLHFIIDNCLNILSPKFKKGVSIKKDYADVAVVKGNSSQLHQVFLNLLANAVQSINNEGTIYLASTFSLEKNMVEVKIKDTGSGIPKGIKDKVFDPFFTTKGPGSGIGLGLSISYGIIKDHQGHIVVTSKENIGTEFLVTLPVNVYVEEN